MDPATSPDTHNQKHTASLHLLLSEGGLALSEGDERGEDEAGKNPPPLSAWKCLITSFSPRLGGNNGVPPPVSPSLCFSQGDRHLLSRLGTLTGSRSGRAHTVVLIVEKGKTDKIIAFH